MPTGFMRQATERVYAAGGVMIADEVQAGLGRSGNWWGYETSDFKTRHRFYGQTARRGCTTGRNSGLARFR